MALACPRFVASTLTSAIFIFKFKVLCLYILSMQVHTERLSHAHFFTPLSIHRAGGGEVGLQLQVFETRCSFLQYYFLITILFSVRTAVNLFCPTEYNVRFCLLLFLDLLHELFERQ